MDALPIVLAGLGFLGTYWYNCFLDNPVPRMGGGGFLKFLVGNKHLIGFLIFLVYSSDVIRLYLIRHFGGWYSDLDMVILRQLSDLRNVIASDSVSAEDSAAVILTI